MDNEPKSMSRAKFLRLTASAGVGVAAVAADLIPRALGEVPPSARLSNGLEVVLNLAKAEKSKNEVKVTEARKLVAVWTFAETASMYSDETGLPMAGKMMEHYLYGNGRDLDISKEMKELGNEDAFWLGLLQSGFGAYYESQTGSYEFYDTAPQEFKKMFDRLQPKLVKGYTFVGSVYGSQGMDWNYAIGHSTYTLQTDSLVNVDGNNVTINFKNTNLKLYDVYDWDLTFAAGISNKAWMATDTVCKPLFQWIMQNGFKVDEMLEKINFPDEHKSSIRRIFESFQYNLRSEIDKVPGRIGKLESWAVGNDGEITEKDMNLLKTIGAKDYTIVGEVFYPSVRTLSTDTHFSLNV
jgi:hypothetical protein